MTNNIYDTANQLERDLRELPAFKSLKEAYQAIQNDEEAKALFEEFRQVQLDLQKKHLEGQDIHPEDIQKAQEVGQKASGNAYVKDLMAAEQQLSQVLEDINRLITKPIQDIYEGR